MNWSAHGQLPGRCPDCGQNLATGATEHRRVFRRALGHACTFRDRIADRPPRPVISAREPYALFDEPTPENRRSSGGRY